MIQAILKTETQWGTSLAVQWLRLRAPNAGCVDSVPNRGTLVEELRSHMLHAVRPKEKQKLKHRDGFSLFTFWGRFSLFGRVL